MALESRSVSPFRLSVAVGATLVNGKSFGKFLHSCASVLGVDSITTVRSFPRLCHLVAPPGS